MSILLSVLMLCSPFWDTNPDHWGIGIIEAERTSFDDVSYVSYALPLGIALPCYKNPQGELAGFLLHHQEADEEYGSFLSFYPLGEERQTVNHHDYREVDYEISSLLVFARRDKWVKVLLNSQSQGVWMNLESIDLTGLSYLNWMDYFMTNDNPYHPPEEFGLNLRTGAGASYDKLVTMKTDRFIIRLTGKTANTYWAEAKVVEYTAHPCEDGQETGREWTGWFKLLDDQGFPNIWYYTRGC